MRRRVTRVGSIIVSGVVASGCGVDMPAPDEECSQCALELHEVVAFGADAGPLSPTSRAWVARGDRGEFFVAPVYTPGTVVVFDSTGTVLRTIGRQGDGPGEFGGIERIFVIAGDTLVVAHEGGAALTFVGPDGEFGREIRVSGRVGDFAADATGDLVVSTRSPAADSGPLQVLTRDGTLRRAFGNVPDEPVEPMAQREFALDSEDRVWSARRNEYRIDLFSPASELDRSISRPVNWFPRATAEAVRAAAMRGEVVNLTSLTDIAIDSVGRPWVLIDRQDPDWRPPADHDPSMPLSFEMVAARVDHIVEVLDPGDGSVILTSQPDPGGVLKGFLDASHVFGLRETTDGNIEAVVWRTKMVQEGASGG